MLDAHLPIFDGALNGLDINQNNFILWCKYYNHHVFSVEDEKRPDDIIIKYDAVLDEWIEITEFQEKARSKQKTSINDMQEVIHFG